MRSNIADTGRLCMRPVFYMQMSYEKRMIPACEQYDIVYILLREFLFAKISFNP